MYWVYILESAPTGRWYIGSTDDPERRLREHNAGKTVSTKAFRPYILLYTESFEDKKTAVQRERQIKRSGGIRKALRGRIAPAASSSNG